jgi:GNAT superfamily N-acetyltransferase
MLPSQSVQVEVVEIQRGTYLLSTDRQRIDVDFVHNFLCHESAWARGIPRAVVERSLRHSLCFGLYTQDRQVGFARVSTDYATFAYIDDVFVVAPYRGRGLGKWLVEGILSHPGLQGLRPWWLLAGSEEARQLFESVGFRTPEAGRLGRWMALPGGSRGFYERLSPGAEATST